jgi:hypothetical protein
MCKEADDYWLSRYPAGLANQRSMSFADQYTHIYDPYSWLSHPRLIGLQSFWDFQPQWTVVHAEEVGDPAHDPLHMGQLLVAQGVLVAAMASGCPNVDEAIDVMNSNAGIARDVREGKLITVEVTPGHFRLAHASRAVPLLGASDVHAQASHRCPPGRSGHMRARATRPAAALNDEGPAPCRALRSGSDGTRTRDLRRDRPAL